MKFEIANDARPQLKLLLIATILSVVLWFIPYTDYLVYPIRLFVTFIHEGGHALMSILTGGSVQSLTVSPDASGLVKSLTGSSWAVLLFSSAGYLGATAFGALLLGLIRFRVSPKIILTGSAIWIAILTVFFGFIAPIINIFSADVSIGSVAFTVISGAIIAAGLFAVSRYSNPQFANFFVGFLAIQCLLNAFFDLKTVFLISTSSANIHNDAANMASVTGIPQPIWVLMWIGISIIVVSIALRLYSVGTKGFPTKNETLFED